MVILVMGVSGSGKSTIAKLLADSLHWEFSDADNFHSPQNIDKMRRGISLDDGDRLPWLQDIQAAIKQWLEDNQNVVTQVASYRFRQTQQGQKSNKIPSRVKIGGEYAKRNNYDLCYH